ncbi:YggS family pyridoxal phosphate-dependent enzyme [Robiginitalea sp. M366]|uniref:YggS family pyridoxal phosphate-dependent enzyme n=1 Tax=Robiginitalea aestuariiviva TaxID=3036903 RepID=UPI00240D055A|nr:YggS family pyridoxal phosphate-dependent enzyme [Robiginitalea aestuariiviva]MDG1573121.1 YggS family pyridoxal phosphate-dependent enzyme [Robiginitalea aestuariiviva]
MSIAQQLKEIREELPKGVTLVAVSKTKSEAEILEAYQAGQRIFGENKVQEMVSKYEALPKDIQWHMIGHLQRNKVKYLVDFVSLIHGVDSLKLLKEIQKRAAGANRVVDCLLQVHIAEEATKFGFDSGELEALLGSGALEAFPNVRLRGLMGMATFTDDTAQVRREFRHLKTLYDRAREAWPNADTLSMGMSGDYPTAIEEGSTMVRIGSRIFGSRNYG